MKIKSQNQIAKKRLFSRIVLSRVVRTLKIPLIDFKCRKYAVLNFLGKITSLDIFVQICVDHPLKWIVGASSNVLGENKPFLKLKYLL
jgi:hypothetical protein